MGGHPGALPPARAAAGCRSPAEVRGLCERPARSPTSCGRAISTRRSVPASRRQIGFRGVRCPARGSLRSVDARRPLLLLDIDGTLCPIGPGPGHAMTSLPGEAGDKYFRSDLPAVLAELGGRYELVWATAWENHANLILARALGLPLLPVVRFSDPAPGEVG